MAYPVGACRSMVEGVKPLEYRQKPWRVAQERAGYAGHLEELRGHQVSKVLRGHLETLGGGRHRSKLGGRWGLEILARFIFEGKPV
jgi:hypothetical protein